MKRILLLYLFLSVSALVIGQTHKNSLSASEVKAAEIERLALSLTDSLPSDSAKAKAIFNWITQHIAYDHEGYRTGYWQHYPSDKALLVDTFSKRRGVCSGYAHLYSYMLGICNIESEVIEGYGRGDLETVLVKDPNHAWNAVNLGGKWYLMDATWASSWGPSAGSFWYQTDPSLFVLSHLPLEEQWTLLKSSYSLTDFLQFPILSDNYYKLGFSPRHFARKAIQTTNNIAAIPLQPPFACLFLPKILKVGDSAWITPTYQDHSADKQELKIHFPDKGKYIVAVSILTQQEEKVDVYKDVILLTIENK